MNDTLNRTKYSEPLNKGHLCTEGIVPFGGCLLLGGSSEKWNNDVKSLY